MNPALDRRYVRCPDFETRVAGLEFAPEVWSVFARLDQPCSANDLAGTLQLSPEAVLAALEQLASAQLIRKHAMGWNEFAAAAQSAPTPPASAPAQVVRPAPDAAVSLRLAPAKEIRHPFLSLRIVQSASSARPAGASDDMRPWKLKPALDAISASAGGGIPGQLLVYKIFLQLPPELLKAANIESPAAVDEHHVVTDPRLRDALFEAARVHAGIDLARLPVPEPSAP
jgi:hypothetical protein